MKYTGIAEVSHALTEMLQQNMIPDVVKSAEQIGLCSPSEKGDFTVMIWLYDIRENEELRSHAMAAIDSTKQKYPSSYVNLYYMITACSGGDVKYQAGEEQQILGKLLQVLQDHAVFERLSGNKEDTGAELICSIGLLNLSMEEKMRVFHAPGMGYKTSLFYEVGPIEIESEKTRQVQRVVDIRFDVEEPEKR